MYIAGNFFRTCAAIALFFVMAHNQVEGNTMTDTPAPTVVIKTSEGDIKLELFADQAPKTVENFLSYVKDGHYTGTIFHRVIEGFMIQGGGYNADLDEKPTREPIENEAKADVKNSRGTIAMARTMEVDSATAQFFINLVDNSFLDHKEPTQAAFGYCVFGRVIDGMDIVDAIGAKATGTSGFMRDVPKEPITIEEISEVSMIHE